MKLSAIFLSVNIAATIPLAACQMASAAEEGMAETSDWLKSSLTSIKKNSHAGTLERGKKRKVSLSEPAIDNGDAAFSKYLARLKPISAGSRLPSKKELELQLMAQTPKMAPILQQSLSGQVSAYTEYNSPYASYASNASYASSAPAARRSAPQAHASESSLSAPEAIRFAADNVRRVSQQAVAGQHRIGTVPPAASLKAVRQADPAHQPASGNMMNIGAAQSLESKMTDWLGEKNLRPGEQVLGQSGALLVQAPALAPHMPVLSDEELKRQMAELSPLSPDPIALATPRIDPQILAPEQHSSVGPPPFPLCLIPEQQLKSFIRGGSRPHSYVSRASFGSWHNNGGGHSSLPPAGFHSFIGHGGFGHYVARQPVNGSRPKNRYAKNNKSNSRTARTANVRRDEYSRPVAVQAMQVKVATYPAYNNPYRSQTF
ncbi:MAG TPA: hypothetical protein V6D17_06150 [Candidatus Obscuribacterales bacterium]